MSNPSANLPKKGLRRKRLVAFGKGVALLFVGVTVAAGLTIGYWWLATHVLLSTSRFREEAAMARKAEVRNDDRDLAKAPTVTNVPPSQVAHDTGWWARERAELATTDTELGQLRGTFGDMFGAVNAFFSALAFACVFYALILQRKDLALQREELEDTRMVAVTAAKLQAYTSNIEAAFQVARFNEGPMSEGLVKEIEVSRREIRKLLDRLDDMKA